MQSFPDIPNDPGNIVKEVTLLNLESVKEYSITVIARNMHGNASHTPTSVSFETYGIFMKMHQYAKCNMFSKLKFSQNLK